MVAAQDGTVAFSGWVGGQLFISIDHADGVRTTYSWLSAVSVKKGDRVRKGGPIGRTGHGHPEVATPHLHFGARIGSTYIDPMLLLTGGSVVGLIRLAPLAGAVTPLDPTFTGPSGRASSETKSQPDRREDVPTMGRLEPLASRALPWSRSPPRFHAASTSRRRPRSVAGPGGQRVLEHAAHVRVR